MSMVEEQTVCPTCGDSGYRPNGRFCKCKAGEAAEEEARQEWNASHDDGRGPIESGR